MPYFLFHIETTQGVRTDEEGCWFSDVRMAKQEALAAARELMMDSIKWGLDHCLPEAIVITEPSGNKVATVHFKDILPRSRRRPRARRSTAKKAPETASD